ncbi:transporter [Hyphomicrobium sp. LHD-15]|uniref:transporter n=1 Tax=Hyphomicrobium sp. LHD-15 TaxID=3072142 RepID=UPI00280D45B8|nr:transporter [Hyphomicrobium sp. LHD-15]MDQ8697234.1 transporter [Hyphomicrobium sp. LHD-15]
MMFRSCRVAVLGIALLLPIHASADELRDFCADRPGLGTPTCIVDRGHVVIETGLADWTGEFDRPTRTDTVVVGNLLVRYGLTDTLEAQIGWDGYNFQRMRDTRGGLFAERIDGAGDMTLALRQSLRNPDGSGFSVAVMPYTTAPTGSDVFSAGDWGAGVIVPISLDLGHGLSLGLSPEIDAAVDGDGDGRHTAYGSVVGLGITLGETVSAALETSVFRDEDPSGPTTIALVGLAFAWQPIENLQLDVGAVAGLNSGSPDAEVYAGIARRF